MVVHTEMRPLHHTSAEDQFLDAKPSHPSAVATQAKGETESLLLRRTLREDHLTLDGDCRDSGSQDPSLDRLDGSTDFKSRREIERNMKRNVRAFWPLVAHFILSILLTIAVFIFVDGRMFYLTSRRPVINDADGSILHADYHLLQSDVTTIISAAQTVVRFVGGSWTAATIRRCIFILLEKEGLSLSNASWMLTWGLPARFKHARVATPLPIWIILLSSVPSQLSSPLLTGSITWKPSYTLMHGQKQLSGIASVGADQPSLGTQLRIYQETVGASIYIRAMRFSYRAWGANTNLSVTSPMRRVIASAESLPVNSILWNVTLPAFSIQSLQWIEDPATEIDPRNLTAFLNSRTYFSPFTNDPSVPAFALLPSPTQGNITDWGPRNPTSQFPKLNKVSETRLLAVFFTRSRMADSPSKCPQDSMLYGPIPPHFGILPVGVSSGDAPVWAAMFGHVWLDLPARSQYVPFRASTRTTHSIRCSHCVCTLRISGLCGRSDHSIW
ncbi:hypothetical protein FPV67DRAFT_991995 [Lyophyllum atratum]|nr:hypothetical protein FPV67DRAFT_991995 [Lyophyllum atratum]